MDSPPFHHTMTDHLGHGAAAAVALIIMYLFLASIECDGELTLRNEIGNHLFLPIVIEMSRLRWARS